MKYPDGKPLRLILRPRSDAQTLIMIKSIDGMDAALEKARLRPELPIAGNDQDNMETASRLTGAFSGFPLTQLSLEPNKLRPVAIDGALPILAAMREGKYRLKLRIDFITKGKPSPPAQRFLDFLATPAAHEMIESAGGVALTPP